MEGLGVAAWRALEALARLGNRNPQQLTLAEYIDSWREALVAKNRAEIEHSEPSIGFGVGVKEGRSACRTEVPRGPIGYFVACQFCTTFSDCELIFTHHNVCGERCACQAATHAAVTTNDLEFWAFCAEADASALATADDLIHRVPNKGFDA